MGFDGCNRPICKRILTFQTLPEYTYHPVPKEDLLRNDNVNLIAQVYDLLEERDKIKPEIVDLLSEME